MRSSEELPLLLDCITPVVSLQACMEAVTWTLWSLLLNIRRVAERFTLLRTLQTASPTKCPTMIVRYIYECQFYIIRNKHATFHNREVLDVAREKGMKVCGWLKHRTTLVCFITYRRAPGSGTGWWRLGRLTAGGDAVKKERQFFRASHG